MAQRNAAREEALMLEAKLKQLQDDMESGRLLPAAGAAAASAAAAAGMLTPPPAGAGADEGMMDRMRRFMQQIPGSSPIRDGSTPMATPSGECRCGRPARACWMSNKKAQPLWLHPPPPCLSHPSTLAFAGRLEAPSSSEPLSEMDRRQRELYAKQQQLLREQRTADQEKLLGAISDNLGFVDGRPVAAVVVFRCCLHWKTFQADRTPLFDRIIATMGSQVQAVPSAVRERLRPCCVLASHNSGAEVAHDLASLSCCALQVELHQENNAYLAYWLSNTVTLLYLMQQNVKPASGGGYAARIKASGQQASICWVVCGTSECCCCVCCMQHAPPPTPPLLPGHARPVWQQQRQLHLFLHAHRLWWWLPGWWRSVHSRRRHGRLPPGTPSNTALLHTSILTVFLVVVRWSR